MEVVVGCGCDDPCGEFDGVGACELVVVVEVADVVDDPGGLGGEHVVGEGSNPCSASVVDRVGQVPVEGMLNCPFPTSLPQFGAEGDELLVECFVFDW